MSSERNPELDLVVCTHDPLEDCSGATRATGCESRLDAFEAAAINHAWFRIANRVPVLTSAGWRGLAS